VLTPTRRALAEAGVPFVEFRAAGDGQGTLPLVTIAVKGEMVVWNGHRPDFLVLLKELVRGGDSIDGFRRTRSRSRVVTRLQAISQVGRRRMSLAQFFARCGNQPLYRREMIRESAVCLGSHARYGDRDQLEGS
jgi:hypothetical protein